MKPSIDYGREDIVKFLYLEPLLSGQRVLVVGPESDVVKQVFQRMGCKVVRLIRPGKEAKPDWDLASLRGKRDSLEAEKRLLPFGAGSFDIIFIPDLAALEDYRMVLAECSRIAAQGGLVIISARNAECTASISQSGLEETPDIWSLESLEELTRTYFEHVENVGQCPFLAYACVSYDPERVAEGVRLDTSLMDERSEEPEFYLILCSRKPQSARLSNAVYQVPMTEMTPAEAPETDAAAAAEARPQASLRNENEMLKKEVADKNVLLARLKKELERVEAEAEQRRQKMFDMKQKMEQERKAGQKEVLEKAIQKQVDRIPETWMGEREAMVREMEQLKKDCAVLRGENRKMEGELEALRREARRPQPQERPPRDRDRDRDWKRDRELMRNEIGELRRENRRLSNENRRLREGEAEGRPKAAADARAAGSAGGDDVEKLRRELEAKERLVQDLLLEMELMPQVGFGDDVPSGEEDVLEVVGKMEEMRKSLVEGGETAARLKARIQELELTLQEERVRASAAAGENQSLKDRITELLATVNMMKDLCEASPDADAAAMKEAAARLDAVVQFCQSELKRLSESRIEESIGRELALLWAKVEEKRRLARGAAGTAVAAARERTE
jgi:hypothetical protein